jgi:AcrR family transcriptional regulator
VSTTSAHLDPRVIRTRQLLRDALMTLIPERGYNALTIQHITDRAGLNRATFYLHYHDKQDLLVHIIRAVLDDLSVSMARWQRTSELAGVRAVFVTIFEHVAANVVFYRVMLEEPSVAPYVQQMQDSIEGIALGWLRASPAQMNTMLTPPDLFVRFIGAAWLGVIRWWVLSGMALPPDVMAAQFMRLAIGGLQHDFGLEALFDSLEQELRPPR